MCLGGRGWHYSTGHEVEFWDIDSGNGRLKGRTKGNTAPDELAALSKDLPGGKLVIQKISILKEELDVDEDKPERTADVSKRKTLPIATKTRVTIAAAGRGKRLY